MRLSKIPGYSDLKKHSQPAGQKKAGHNLRQVKRALTKKTLMPGHTGRRHVESGVRRIVYSILDVITYLVSPGRGKFRAPGPELKDWMSRLYTGPRENTRIADSTMIGSHDAASYGLSGFGSSMAITQSRSIGPQLEAGVRYLDIRITLDDKGQYIVHHGPYHGKGALKAVVEPLKKFLQRNPDEVVVVKLQFSQMSKATARKFLWTEFGELMKKRALSNRDKYGNRIGPGSLTFKDAHKTGRNLLVTVSDEHLGKSEKIKQEELGKHAWHHGEFSNDLWPNSSDVRNVKAYTEKHVLGVMTKSKETKDGKLDILQLQTNINPLEFLKGGINSVERLARFSNKKIPVMLRHWYKQKGFIPNIILQDFIGHYNYRDISLLALTFSTRTMSEDELKASFPRLHRAILRVREQLER